MLPKYFPFHSDCVERLSLFRQQYYIIAYVVSNSPSLHSFRLAPGLVFSDQFLQFSTYLPSSNLYGLGEHVDRLQLNTSYSTYTMFASDIGTNPDVSSSFFQGLLKLKFRERCARFYQMFAF